MQQNTSQCNMEGTKCFILVDSCFVIKFQFLSPGKECIPGSSSQVNVIEISTPTGNISSPGFPNRIPNEPFTCTWRIKAPEGQVVKLDLNTYQGIIEIEKRRVTTR